MRVFVLNRIARSEKYNPDIIKRYKETLALDPEIEIVSVISKSLDKMETAEALRQCDFEGRVVHVVESENWTTLFKTDEAPGTWSLALNDGLNWMMFNLNLVQNDILWVMSDLAQLSCDTYQAMKAKMLTGKYCAVGVRFPEFTSFSYQHVRNTCGMWWLEEVLKHNGFSRFCDLVGGQEDYELLRRMHYSGHSHAMVPGKEGELGVTPVRAQSDKERMELEAIAVIDKLHENIFGPLPGYI